MLGAVFVLAEVALFAVVGLSSFDDFVPLTRGTTDCNDCHATLLKVD
jgi:hypothetical protein